MQKEERMAMESYYHAGIEIVSGPEATTIWSRHTRRTFQAAAAEARRLARRTPGSHPIVESWDRSWGMRPGTADAVSDCQYIAVSE